MEVTAAVQKLSRIIAKSASARIAPTNQRRVTSASNRLEEHAATTNTKVTVTATMTITTPAAVGTVAIAVAQSTRSIAKTALARIQITSHKLAAQRSTRATVTATTQTMSHHVTLTAVTAAAP